MCSGCLVQFLYLSLTLHSISFTVLYMYICLLFTHPLTYPSLNLSLTYLSLYFNHLHSLTAFNPPLNYPSQYFNPLLTYLSLSCRSEQLGWRRPLQRQSHSVRRSSQRLNKYVCEQFYILTQQQYPRCALLADSYVTSQTISAQSNNLLEDNYCMFYNVANSYRAKQ